MPVKSLTPKSRSAAALGKAIKQAREALDLTQLALAHKLGYKGSDAGAYVSRVECGLQEPRLASLKRFAKALRVSVADLLGAK